LDQAKRDLEGHLSASKKLLAVEEEHKPVPGTLDLQGVLEAEYAFA